MKYQSIDEYEIDGYPLLLRLERVVDFLQRQEGDPAKCLHAFRIASFLEHYWNAYDFRENLEHPIEAHNVFKLVNVYGYGLCKQISLVMQFLLDQCGIRNRVLYMEDLNNARHNHSILETWYDNSWHAFDPDVGVFFMNRGQVVDADAIAGRAFDQIDGAFNGDGFARCGPHRSQGEFEAIYRAMHQNRETIEMLDDRYAWKQTFMRSYGLARWYSAAQPVCYLPEDCGVRVERKGKGIAQAKLVGPCEHFDFENVMFTFSPNGNEFDLNDFPFPVLGIRLEFGSDSESSVDLFIGGNRYERRVRSGEDLVEALLPEHERFFDRPVYGFILKSDQAPRSIEIRTLAASARKKILDYMATHA